MKTSIKMASVLVGVVLPLSVFADDTLYCPQTHGYVSLGMTMDQVKAGCGDPLSVEESKHPYMQKVPVQQLFYTNKGTQQAVHSPFTVNIGYGGAQLQVNVVNNKVSSIVVNNGGTNAASFCEGAPIQVGDEASKVYASCGAPTIVNNSYINEPITTVNKPVVWIYKPGDNQPSRSLTFVDGKLQSIQ